MVSTHHKFNPKKTYNNPFQPRYICRPARENLPKSILEWLDNNPKKKDDEVRLNEFSHDPAHLQAWHMQPALRHKLPAEVLTCVVAMQEAGAAVLTSMERLIELQESLEEDEQKRKLEAHNGKHTLSRPIPPVPLACRLSSSDDDDVASISTGATAGSASSNSVDSFCSDMTSRTTIPSRSSSTAAPMEKRPTLSFTQLDTSDVSNNSTSNFSHGDTPSDKLRSEPITFLTIPMESTPARARYSAERFHLRSEALVNLSGYVRQLDSVFGKYTTGDDQTTFCMDESVYDEFEQWYRGKKAAIRALEVRILTLKVDNVVLNADSGTIN